LSQRIPHIAKALKQTNVTCVQIKYDGQFDLGILEDPIYLTAEGIPVDSGISRALQHELRVFFDELLELRFPQWDNAEGSRGEFQWHLSFDQLAQAHFTRCIDYKVAVLTGL
jgi:hypothetical protein